MHVLLASAQSDRVGLIRSALETEGFEVSVAETAEDCLTVALETAPVAVLLDIALADGDGFAACSSLREHADTADIPIIFLVEESNPSDRVRGFEAGADDFVTRPFCIEEIVLRVKSVIRRFQSTARKKEEMEKVLADLTGRNQVLQEQAITDHLTGLYNHRFFWSRLREEIARASRYGRILSLLMLDVDDFKGFNDTQGHLAGDEVLRSVGQTLRQSIRGTDVVARYGGEEFAAIFPETPLSGANIVAERIRSKIAALRFEQYQLLRVTVSGGIAAYPDHGSAAEDLVSSADAALYTSKARGKNRISYSQ
ncbi:MAG: diguanylate cyclase [Armatimonadetes bacterium]|nr:diguanylate cyclase [Armatimonadota bacterium]